MGDKFKKKTYCYKNECKVVRTGFHLENYPVCSHCKEEITESLYNIIKERNEPDTEKEEDPWTFI
jgi:predicted secreted Zn-dependent protease